MNISKIDLNLLRAFVAVFDTGNISRAAETLGLSQPAMSNAMARLRKQIDDPLFVRTGNGVTPTQKANALVTPIRRALLDIDRAFSEDVQFDPNTAEKVFRIMVTDMIEHILLPKLVETILPYKGLSIEMLPPQMHEVEAALEDGIVDLAVFLQPRRTPEILFEPLYSFDLVIVVRNGHPALDDAPSLEIFRNYGLASLLLRPDALANIEKVKVWQRLGARSVVSLNRVGAIGQLVSKSDLIGIVPRIYAETIAEEIGLSIIEPPSPLGSQKIFSIWHQRHEHDEANSWFRAQVRDALEGYDP